MQYRPEIDGMRAIAVASVILAHAGFSFFKGGFVGVDVFFVISGYLITSIMLSEWNDGKFSMISFYERRARRILPALFCVFIACIPFAWVLMVPSQFTDFSRSIAAAAIFISNVHFWEKTGYFDPDADLQPLLHTWSLAVEEQYYLLFPVVFMLTMKVSRRFLVIVITIFIIISSLLSNWGAQNYPAQNFFFTFSRFWEIFLGAFCALVPVKVRKPFDEILPAIGLVMIAISIFTYTASTPFPSYFTFLPVIGSALVLWCSTPDTVTTRILSNRGFVGLGLISYSAYLWHQPIFAFARLHNIAEPPAYIFSLLIGLIIGLSYITWKYVEQPFRNKGFISRQKVLLGSIIGILIFFSLGLASYEMKFILNKFTKEEQVLLNYALDYKYNSPERKFQARTSTCMGMPEGYENLVSDICVNSESKGNVLIWGDSHSQSLAPGFMHKGLNVSLIMAAGCPPMPNIHFRRMPYCYGTNKAAMEYVKDTKPEFIIMHANWYSHYQGKRAIYNTTEKFYQGLIRTIGSIREASPESKIIIISGVPQWGIGLPEYMVRLGNDVNSELYLSSVLYPALQDLNDGFTKRLPQDNVTVVDPLEYMCEEGRCLATVEYDGKIYLSAWDYGHITEAAAVFLADKILAIEGFPIGSE